jgi:uncharacterized iron-regulated protein
MQGVARWFAPVLAVLALLITPPALADIQPAPGLIWDVRAERPIARAALMERLVAADVVLLGEKHDNARHHVLQAEILKDLAAAGRRPALVWEMLPRSAQPRIDRFLDQNDRRADGFAEAVGWERLGWGDWALYRPVAEAAVAAGLRQRAGGLERAALKAIGQGGLPALPKHLAARLPEGPTLSESQKRVIEDAVFEGHCGYIPRRHLAPMIAVQTARDLALADAVAVAAGPGGAVLIAGSQHVRRDAGVPVHLVRMLPDASVVVISFVEVTDRGDRPDQPPWKAAARAGAYDFLWFSAPAPEKDYCADLAKQFGLKKD